MKKPSEEDLKARRSSSALRRMSDEEFFTSAAFSEFMYICLRAVVLSKKAKGIKIAIYAKDDGKVAYTDSQLVCVNCLGPFVTELKRRKEKFELMTGIAVHEFAHILYTDWEVSNRVLQEWNSGRNPLGIETEIWERIQAKGSAFRSYCHTVFADYDNLFDDAYIEYEIHQEFAGFPSSSLRTARMAARNHQRFIDELFPEDVSETSIVFYMFLSSIGNAPVKWKDEKSVAEKYPDKYFMAKKLYEEIRPYWTALESIGDYEERYKLFGKVFSLLFPYIEKKYEEEGEAESKEQEGKEETESMESRSSLLDELEQLAAEAGVMPLPEIPKPEKKDIPKTKGDFDLEDGDDLEDQIAKTIMEENRREGEAERLTDLLDSYEDVERTFKFSKQNVGPYACAIYRDDRKTVGHIVSSTTNALDRVLKERKRGGKVNGFLMGKKIDTSQAYRRDKRIFSQEIANEGAPDVAFGILVDESGSMCMEDEHGIHRCDAARRAAIAMDAVLRKLEISHCVVGHTAGWTDPNKHEVEFLEYVKFDSTDEKEMYSLGNITDRDNNHDLAALLYMEGLLKKRNEAKILLVISDGQPFAVDFKGEPAVKKTAEAVEKMKKNGITVIAACLAESDLTSLQKIYGKECVMDVSDLSQMSQKMMKVLKYQILTRRAK